MSLRRSTCTKIRPLAFRHRQAPVAVPTWSRFRAASNEAQGLMVHLRIGTRKSVMALAQTKEIAAAADRGRPGSRGRDRQVRNHGRFRSDQQAAAAWRQGRRVRRRDPRRGRVGTAAGRDAFAEGHAGQRRYSGAGDRRDAVARSAGDVLVLRRATAIRRSRDLRKSTVCR